MYDYDQDKYDNIKMVPSKLRQQVFENTNNPLLATKPGQAFSDLPSGLKGYISSNPDEFKKYFETRHHEVGLMKSVLKAMTPMEKKQRTEHYKETKHIESQTLKDIFGNVPPGKRKKGKTGGQLDDEFEQSFEGLHLDFK